ncbi:Gfo/Idh/MocA family oxidoreductase [Paenibacillus anaericanus]|uniref:Gfo/Idh/MocA family oxidoreductase n=1 Tax=Paenibacillus anaericanus TaxID=170367 RepID=A0A433YCI2_9BACL|nr:Gfo/Idh/MocA family oxidoreductase [Paenibacillus anaericanus]RUT47590.1 Gfo/Idh/MocA family oxidoreductase [Paenibacillus anaericanus]
MNNKIYSLVIVGYGGMGSQHGRKLEEVSRIKVTGVYDIKEVRQAEARTKGYKVYEDYQAVLDDPSVDIILIATPNDSHHPITLQALHAGKHVICEKPAMMNSQEVKDVMSASEETGKVFMVHQNRRWDEDYLAIKKLVDEKELGDVFYVETRVHGSRGIPGDWRHDLKHGGGMLLDWGVHLLDRLLILFPEKVTSVYAKLSYILGHEVDDGVKVYLTFEGGRTALMEVGTTNFITLPLWYVTGLNGAAVIEDWDMNGKVAKWDQADTSDAVPIVAGAGLTKTMAPRAENTVSEYPVPRVECDVRDFYYNFIDTIENTAERIVTNEEVLRIMTLMEAVFESDKTGEVVHLNL